MNLFYLPYNFGSASVRELQEVSGGLKIRLNHSNYVFRPARHLLVNWGHGDTPNFGVHLGVNPRILNHWSKVANAINKLKAFEILSAGGVGVPLFSRIRADAKNWTDAGEVVFCRTLLSSMEGRGIKIARNSGELVDAPLYTKLFHKDKEYRVHVFKGEVIDYVQKKLRAGAPADRCKYVRNTANGWIFARSAVSLPDSAKQAAVQAVTALGLDFGAVDLAQNKSGKVVVFEVNTAPGLEGTTIQKYADAIKTYQQSL